MKIDRLTEILIKLMLILIIVLLLKSLITIPKYAYAKESFVYRVAYSSKTMEGLEQDLNYYAKEGWRLHSIYQDRFFILIR